MKSEEKCDLFEIACDRAFSIGVGGNSEDTPSLGLNAIGSLSPEAPI